MPFTPLKPVSTATTPSGGFTPFDPNKGIIAPVSQIPTTNATQQSLAGKIGGALLQGGKNVVQAVEHPSVILDRINALAPKGSLVDKNQDGSYVQNPENMADAASKALAFQPGEFIPEKGIVNTVKDLAGEAKGAASTVVNKITGKLTPEESVTKITDAISPKPTVKEAKLATTQGRMVAGKDPTLFKAGTEPAIKPTSSIVRAAKTIFADIKGAIKMDPPTLYKAVDNHIETIATNLKPKMAATEVKPQSVIDATAEWNKVKADQLDSSLATDEPNVIKRQTQFEKNFLSQSMENLDQVWDSAKKYDQSIPDRVKSANSLSSDALQQQRAEWIQNREIFKKIMYSAENGLEKDARESFQKMTDLYSAKDGILSKASATTKAAPSKIRQFADSKTAKGLKTGLQLAGGAYAAEKAKEALGF